MKNLFVSYEIAKQLKEKGFGFIREEQCFGWYKAQELTIQIPDVQYGYGCLNMENTENCIAPLYDQVLGWFRDKHQLHFYIETTPVFDKMQGSQYKTTIKKCFSPFTWTTAHYYRGYTYHESLNKAIIEALKII